MRIRSTSTAHAVRNVPGGNTIVRKPFHSTSLFGLLAMTLATAGVLVATSPAPATHPQTEGFTRNPDDNTAQLVSTTAVRRPRADALASANGTVFLGGLFDVVRDDAGTHTRRFIAAVDEFDGQVTPFSLALDRRVRALATDGDSLYVGGDFRSAGGVSRRFLVKVDAETGAVDTAFNARLRGKVQDLEFSRGMLFVSGAFGKNLVALDPATGADTGFVDLDIAGEVQTSWGTTSVYSFSIDASGTRLVGVGNFATVEGQGRARAFMADLGADDATLADWYYAPLSKNCATSSTRRMAYLQGVDFAPSGEYFAVASTGFVSRPGDLHETVCDAAARFETDIANPFRPTWINYTGGDSLFAVVATGYAVYVQGHNRWLDNPQGSDSAGPGHVVRRGIGAIDPETGMALPWNPAKPAQVGGQAFLSTPTGLWVGSDSAKFSGEQHRGLAYVPLR